MEYPSYLVHFNKNHSPKNDQFVSGDGDGDSVRDDHHNYSKNKVTSPKGTSIKTETKSGTYKSYDNKDLKYETEKTVIKKENGNRKIVDNLITETAKRVREEYGLPKNYKFSPSEIGDFAEANSLFDHVGAIAADIYDQTKDVKQAVKYITDNMEHTENHNIRMTSISGTMKIKNEEALKHGKTLCVF